MRWLIVISWLLIAISAILLAIFTFSYNPDQFIGKQLVELQTASFAILTIGIAILIIDSALKRKVKQSPAKAVIS